MVLVGNAKLLTKNQIEFPAEIASIPETIVVCAVNGAYAGYILVADAPKEDAKKAIDSLKELGIKNIVMLPVISRQSYRNWLRSLTLHRHLATYYLKGK